MVAWLDDLKQESGTSQVDVILINMTWHGCMVGHWADTNESLAHRHAVERQKYF